MKNDDRKVIQSDGQIVVIQNGKNILACTAFNRTPLINQPKRNRLLWSIFSSINAPSGTVVDFYVKLGLLTETDRDGHLFADLSENGYKLFSKIQ